MGFGSRLQHAWNAFKLNDAGQQELPRNLGTSSYIRQDIIRFRGGNEQSIVNSIYTRLAIDVAAVTIQHVKVDQNGRYSELVNDELNKCLTVEANIDQTGRAFIQDVAMSLFDEGCVAVIPVDTTMNPKLTDSYKINTLRVGKILQWYPRHIQVRLYNDRTGEKEDLVFPKEFAAIIENPLYSVMNESNSTLKRLIHKLGLLDAIDEQSSSGKLDLIIQLPYVVKNAQKQKLAEERRKDIEVQLTGSKYGIAYIDGTEHVTQLNRPAENNLMSQIEYLTSMLYSQLGLTQAVFDGTADEATMLNYYNRTIEPVLSAIVDEMRRKFLTKTARSQGHSIMFFRDPFRLVPVNEVADIADKLTRNEILSPNEVRAIIGYKPSDDRRANELRNRNLNQETDGSESPVTVNDDVEEE